MRQPEPHQPGETMQLIEEREVDAMRLQIYTLKEQLAARDRECLELAGVVEGWMQRAESAEAKLAEREKFKAWVHEYLDSKGVPHHPPGTHGDHGCRIGDRMDWVWAGIDELKAKLAKMEALLGKAHRYVVAYAVEAEGAANEGIDEDEDGDEPRDFQFVKDAKALAKEMSQALARWESLAEQACRDESAKKLPSDEELKLVANEKEPNE